MRILNEKITELNGHIKVMDEKGKKIQEKIHVYLQSLEQIKHNLITLTEVSNTPHKNRQQILQDKLKNDQLRIQHQIDLLSTYRKELEEMMQKYHHCYQSMASQINNAITTQQLQTGGYRIQLHPTQIEEIERIIYDIQQFIKRFEHYRTTLNE